MMGEMQAEYGGASYAPKDVEPQKPGALARQEDALRYLHDRIDLLFSRLEGVLSADAPSEVAMREDSTSYLEGMIGEIHRAGGRIDNILSRLVL